VHSGSLLDAGTSREVHGMGTRKVSKHQHVAAVCPCSGTHTADSWNYSTDPVLHALNARLLASCFMRVHT
jgi:hypothetical protein